MAVLKINKLNAGAIIAAAEEPKHEWRNIGGEAIATDGTLRVTAKARKRDLKFKSVPLTVATSFAWASLISGEGEVWSFDSSLYGSKGSAPSTNVGCTFELSVPKYGAGRLNVPATTGSIAYPITVMVGDSTKWSAAFWRSTDSGATWTHYVIRSDGAKWVNGSRNDAASTTWFSVTTSTASITNTTGSAVKYDDLVLLPFLVLDDWPSQMYSAGVAYVPAPYLDLEGDLIDDGTRRVLGKVTEAFVKTAGGIRRKLEVELKAK